MQWFLTNAVPLIGNMITIATLVLGFYSINHQAKVHYIEDQKAKNADREIESLKTFLRLIESLRIKIWIISVTNSDLDTRTVDENIINIMKEISEVQTEMMVNSIFLPDEIQNSMEPIYVALSTFKNEINGNDSKEKMKINEKIETQIEKLRRVAISYIKDKRKEYIL